MHEISRGKETEEGGVVNAQKFFYKTNYPLPGGWTLYSTTEDWKQEYLCSIRTAGKRGFRLCVIVTRGEISFRTLYRENFKKEYVEAVLQEFKRFYDAYLSMKKEVQNGSEKVQQIA